MKNNTATIGRFRSYFLRAVVSASLVGAVGLANAPAADAAVFVGGNLLTTGGSCGLGPVAMYSVSYGNYGNPQQVRVYTQVYGGSTTVTAWETAAAPSTTGFLVARVPRGYWYRQYVQYREWNIARGWLKGGEWVNKTQGQWCRA